MDWGAGILLTADITFGHSKTNDEVTNLSQRSYLQYSRDYLINKCSFLDKSSLIHAQNWGGVYSRI